MKRIIKNLLQALIRELKKEKIGLYATMTDGYSVSLKDQRLVIEDTKKLTKEAEKEALKIKL